MAEQKPRQQTVCRRCHGRIVASFPHCTSPTCPWCRECGEATRPKKP